MKNKSYFFVIPFVLFISLNSCKKNDSHTNEPDSLLKSTREIVSSDNDFGIEIFKSVLQKEADSSNVFISPVSISLALAMTYNGAEGTTKEAMETTLKKSGYSIDEINQLYKNLMQGLLSVDPKVTLEIANSIWYRQGFEVIPDFINVNRNYFKAEVNALDFNSPNSVLTINNWVSDNTNNKIDKIINEIPGDAVMYLINAIYFKGTWTYEFDKGKTTDRTFTLMNDSTVDLPFMEQETDLNYQYNDLFSAVELPYGKANYSMIVLLPNYGKTINDIIAGLNSDAWNSWTHSFTLQDVVVRLPKFRFQFKEKLNDALTDMGMGIAFTDAADFSKINDNSGLKISKVLHKTFVEVNEEGTEAAAVTSVEIVLTSAEGPFVLFFDVNKPFLFIIREKESNAIIFIGRVMNPVWET
jgi:serine protease inhibitor